MTITQTTGSDFFLHMKCRIDLETLRNIQPSRYKLKSTASFNNSFTEIYHTSISFLPIQSLPFLDPFFQFSPVHTQMFCSPSRYTLSYPTISIYALQNFSSISFSWCSLFWYSFLLYRTRDEIRPLTFNSWSTFSIPLSPQHIKLCLKKSKQCLIWFLLIWGSRSSSTSIWPVVAASLLM